MKKIFRTLSFFLIFFSLIANFKVYAAELPTITFVGLDRNPVLEGQKQTFHISSINADKVQYKIWICYPGTNTWEDITKGYTEGVKANKVLTITPDKVLQQGNFRGSIWVKREGKTGYNKNQHGDYDNYYAFNFPVLTNNSSSLDLSGKIITDKDTYKVGDTIKITGIDNISGMKQPYNYKLHVYDITKNKWLMNIDGYKDIVSWQPTQAGQYVLDIWAKSNGSQNKYDGFKLKIINVENNNDSTNNNNDNDSNNSDDIFNQPGIENKAAVENFNIKDGKLYFNCNGVSNYLLNEKLNPNINKQIYNVTKALIGDERYNYVCAWYFKDDAGNVSLCPHKDYQIDIFRFTFYEFPCKYNNGVYDYNSNIVLAINALTDTSDRIRPTNNKYDPYYVNCLKNGLVALFGQSNGNDIYNYVLNNTLRVYNIQREFLKDEVYSKQFGNITVHFTNYARRCTCYFEINR